MGKDNTSSPDDHAVGIGVGNSVTVEVDSCASFASYAIVGTHFQGNRAFGTEPDTTAILYVEGQDLIGQAGLKNLNMPSVTPGVDDMTGEAPGGGTNISAWKAL